MVRFISQLKGSLRRQFVVLKLGSQAGTQTHPEKQGDVVTVPNLRAMMESRVQIPANTQPPTARTVSFRQR